QASARDPSPRSMISLWKLLRYDVAQAWGVLDNVAKLGAESVALSSHRGTVSNTPGERLASRSFNRCSASKARPVSLTNILNFIGDLLDIGCFKAAIPEQLGAPAMSASKGGMVQGFSA